MLHGHQHRHCGHTGLLPMRVRILPTFTWPPTMSSLGPHAAMACPAEGLSTGGTTGAELPFSAGASAGLGVTACHARESKCSIHKSPRYLPPIDLPAFSKRPGHRQGEFTCQQTACDTRCQNARTGPTAVAAKDEQLRADHGRCMLIARRRPLGPLHIGSRPDAYRRSLQGRAGKIGSLCSVRIAIVRQRAERLLMRL